MESLSNVAHVDTVCAVAALAVTLLPRAMPKFSADGHHGRFGARRANVCHRPTYARHVSRDFTKYNAAHTISFTPHIEWTVVRVSATNDAAQVHGRQ